MDQLVERCAGLDVHRDTVVATVRRPRPGGGRASKTLTFFTTTAELTALGDWLVAEEVDLVGMESTGVYWKPVYFLLEERIPQVWLLNAEHLHNVPGRKTDVADSAWIAQLLEHGLVAPSFVPPAPIRELRDLTRHRRVLIEERTRVIQRLEKVLQDAGIKLSSVASTLLTKSGRAILDALLAGSATRPSWQSWPRDDCAARSRRCRRRWPESSGSPTTASWSPRCWPTSTSWRTPSPTWTRGSRPLSPTTNWSCNEW
jgi:transposase